MRISNHQRTQDTHYFNSLDLNPFLLVFFFLHIPDPILCTPSRKYFKKFGGTTKIMIANDCLITIFYSLE